MAGKTRPRIAIVVPTYGSFAYARRCLASLSGSVAADDEVEVFPLVIDDASPDWAPPTKTDLAGAFDGRVAVFRFETHGGLTRSWNAGVELAMTREIDADYVALANSDLVFAGPWWKGMVEALKEPKVAFVGPLSNAPGVSSGGVQDVRRWWHDGEFRTEDSFSIDSYNWAANRRLWADNAGRFEPCDINGFFMMGRAFTFRVLGAAGSFLPPRIDVMPSGRRNPTPLMTGQEDHLNHKVKAAGLVNAAALGSYVFHYRSVSRGVRHAEGQDWYRIGGRPAVA